MIFTTDDDVLELLKEGVKGSVNGKNKGLFCRESGADGKKIQHYVYNPSNFFLRQDNKLIYQKAGIYFSLQAKINMQYYDQSLGLWLGFA